jgi:hypothetical protein
MALYRLSIKIISRGAGRSAVGAAAYRSGERLHLEREALTFDYRKRAPDVAHSELFGAGGRSREELWNAAEWAERRWDAVVAREIVVALPHELTLEQNVALLRRLGWWLAREYGVAADVSLHRPSRHPRADRRNAHGHVLVTTRQVTRDGFGQKTRVLDSPKTGPAEVRRIRTKWRQMVNYELDRARVPVRVDERSYADQGLNRIPGRHLGPRATLTERQGGTTAVGDHNRAVALANRVREWLGPGFGRMPRTARELRRDAEAMRDLAWKLRVEGEGKEPTRQFRDAQRLADELWIVLRPLEKLAQLEKRKGRVLGEDRGLSR